MAWTKCVLYMAVVLVLLTPTLCMRSAIYELDTASYSNDGKVAQLDWSQCAIRYADFNHSAVRFSTGVPQQCESLDLEWMCHPTNESGFLYARKRRNAEDFRAYGGVIAHAIVHTQTQENETKLRVLL
ncbi:hypothetical protein DPMN_033919 [Dreissena polymorpha]|uniref:Uncharacterized protein n=1 Tax=Dreissena polymorpha TaxID=45954 RepID=A0A9D4M4I1_DREPO|nr:hypothetical protein DPMN_033919 [Dreissena polymorpha]